MAKESKKPATSKGQEIAQQTTQAHSQGGKIKKKECHHRLN